MSMNIFIDVDGTLINSNEGVDPRAEETLRQIRRKLDAEYPDSGLYLWSGAGGDYARSKAQEHGLAGYFSGFVGKPDVIIDDNPFSVSPRKVILWHGDYQWQNLISSMFTQFSPSDDLIELAGKIIKTTDQEDVDKKISELYDEEFPNIKINPIPFFGDLENAEILTLGVNPSPTEFDENRCWRPKMEAKELSFRLVNYFRLKNPPYHGWFAPLETILRNDNCSYLSNSAHIDLSPRATRKMGEFHGNSTKFLDMVNDDANKWLSQLFQLAKMKKRFRICGKIVSRSNSGSREWCEWPWLDDYIKDNLPKIWALIKEYDYDRIEILSCEMN
jgi:hypothetical protein